MFMSNIKRCGNGLNTLLVEFFYSKFCAFGSNIINNYLCAIFTQAVASKKPMPCAEPVIKIFFLPVKIDRSLYYSFIYLLENKLDFCCLGFITGET